MSDNEWSRPSSPPPPLFLGEKERSLVKQVNDELVENIIGQQILYYPIDIETTNFNSTYGEAIVKNFLPPVRVYALVEWTSFSSTYLDGMGLDNESAISVSFHKKRLNDDQNLFVRLGDFVLYGEIYYEVMKLEEPKLLFGQVDHIFEIKATCKKARKGLFDAT
jgi:hypothetical protein